MLSAPFPLLIAAALTCGCSMTNAVETAPGHRDDARGIAVDSIVLERSLTMPGDPGTAYRLRLDEEGGVHIAMYKHRPPHDWRSRVTVEAIDSVAPGAVEALAAEAARIGFHRLPEELRAEKRLCPVLVTDHQTVTMTIYRAAAVNRVEFYTGCYRDAARYGTPLEDRVVPELRPLVRFIVSIENAADIARWINWAEPRLSR
jgi:hypothetical protein